EHEHALDGDGQPEPEAALRRLRELGHRVAGAGPEAGHAAPPWPGSKRPSGQELNTLAFRSMRWIQSGRWSIVGAGRATRSRRLRGCPSRVGVLSPTGWRTSDIRSLVVGVFT